MSLPPGQRRVDGFPRFGTHLHRPAPDVPADPTIEISGAVTEPLVLRVADLATLPRRELTADFHCVAGWSATGLRWEGVPFSTFHDAVIAPLVPLGASVTHLAFAGLDGYRSVMVIEDALATDVLIADRLDDRPLNLDHGAPARLVSPAQYGFISTKHLSRIELYTGEPSQPYHRSPVIQFGLQMVKPHPRARVWQEERHRYLPAWILRPVYRRLIRPIRLLAARGRRS